MRTEVPKQSKIAIAAIVAAMLLAPAAVQLVDVTFDHDLLEGQWFDIGCHAKFRDSTSLYLPNFRTQPTTAVKKTASHKFDPNPAHPLCRPEDRHSFGSGK